MITEGATKPHTTAHFDGVSTPRLPTSAPRGHYSSINAADSRGLCGVVGGTSVSTTILFNVYDESRKLNSSAHRPYIYTRTSWMLASQLSYLEPPRSRVFLPLLARGTKLTRRSPWLLAAASDDQLQEIDYSQLPRKTRGVLA